MQKSEEKSFEPKLEKMGEYEKLQECLALVTGVSRPNFDFSIVDSVPGPLDLVSHPDITSPTPLFEGPVRLRFEYWRVCDTVAFSRPMVSPTWGEILREINRILEENSSDFIYLEGLIPLQRLPDGTLEVEVVFGS